MKKLIMLLFTILLAGNNVCAEEIKFVLENADFYYANIFAQSLENGTVEKEIDGKVYYFYYANSVGQCQECTEAYKIFSKEFGVNTKYLQTGKNYMVSSGADVLLPGAYIFAREIDKTLGIYDGEFNLITKKVFDGAVIDFFDKKGICYVKIGVGKERHDYEYQYYCSDSLDAWNKINEEEYMTAKDIIIYENENLSSDDYDVCAQANWFMWNIKYDAENEKTYLFIDKSRAMQINLDLNCILGGFVFAYEDADYFYISGNKRHLKTPKGPFYAELERLEAAPIIQIDDKILSFETAPVIENGRTLVPMRFLFETLGADVEWDNETQTASVVKNSDVVAFSIDSTEAEVNGVSQTLDVPARLIEDKTFVPIRFLSENLGYDVEWDGENNKVIINTQE